MKTFKFKVRPHRTWGRGKKGLWINRMPFKGRMESQECGGLFESLLLEIQPPDFSPGEGQDRHHNQAHPGNRGGGQAEPHRFLRSEKRWCLSASEDNPSISFSYPTFFPFKLLRIHPISSRVTGSGRRQISLCREQLVYKAPFEDLKTGTGQTQRACFGKPASVLTRLTTASTVNAVALDVTLDASSAPYVVIPCTFFPQHECKVGERPSLTFSSFVSCSNFAPCSL